MLRLSDHFSRMDTSRIRLQMAFRQPQPNRAALELARVLRDEGLSQLDLYQLFDEFRAAHASDVDETIYDAILDTMDSISGWCNPSCRLDDTDLPHDAA